jgi:hypothetical protein
VTVFVGHCCGKLILVERAPNLLSNEYARPDDTNNRHHRVWMRKSVNWNLYTFDIDSYRVSDPIGI